MSVARPGIMLALVREIRWIFRRKVVVFMTIIFPLLVFYILTGVFGTGLPVGLPIADIDKDHSSLSRHMLRMVDASPDVAITNQVDDIVAGRQLILEGKAYAIVLIPANLERDVKAGRRPEVIFFYNNQFMTIGSIVSRALNEALSTAAAELAISTRLAHGQVQALAVSAVAPIPVQQSALFNPTLNYIYFLLASFIPTILQIFVCATSAYTVGLDRYRIAGLGTLHRIGGSLGNALIGKTLPYTVIFFLTLTSADLYLFGRLDAPFRGHLAVLIASSVLFVASYQLIGILFALVARDLAQALGIAGLYTAPSFGFVGISFPKAAMGWFAKAWSLQLPLNWYLEIRLDQTLRGASLEASARPLTIQLMIAALLTVLVVLRLEFLRRQRLASLPGREARI
ncbi:MAG: ABC transporter permease [Ferrovibrio sp.]|uniref:ABC transporter permease n=1 Tax=Ferrovibrio sp. TaxID=1917215 RepID=UPI00391B5509